MNAKISVIVPVYNTAPWLIRCLDSICSQSYRNLEILCVNDGSTDNSAEILAEYEKKDTRIKVLTQANAGLSAARNTGLEHATGEWVTGVDSDDFLYPDIYEQASAYCNEGANMVFFGVREVDEEGKELQQKEYFNLPAPGEYEITPKLAAQLNVCFWSKLWRRSMLEEEALRFPVGLVHEDEALYWSAMPYVGRIAVCRAVGYAYMQRRGSIMNADGLDIVQRVSRRVPILEHVHAEYKGKGNLSSENRDYLVTMFRRLCGGHYWAEPQEKRQQVRQILGQVIKKSGMMGDDYHLARFVEQEQKGILRIKRSACLELYRIIGIPIWFKWYTHHGRRVTITLLLSHLKSKLQKILKQKNNKAGK